jgi:GNAT superfamily N-acetyltransferase
LAIVIRPIREVEISDAVKVIIGGSTKPQFEDPENVEAYWSAVEETRARRGDVLVADNDGQVVGVCQVLIFQHFQHSGGWCCEVESVHVRADQRSQGIGTRLLEAAETFAIEQGCYRIQLTSNNVREDAHRFYQRLGYEATHHGFKKHFNVRAVNSAD